MHSKKVGGEDAFFVDPVHIPINYENVYDTSVQ
jgi:oligopeptide transport system substrate-binding protein